MEPKTLRAAEYVIAHINRAVRKFHLSASDEFDLMFLIGVEVDGRFSLESPNANDPAVRNPGVTTLTYPADNEFAPHLLRSHRGTMPIAIRPRDDNEPPKSAA